MMSACTPSATISVKEAVLAPKPIVAMPLRHRGGLSLTAARDQCSQVLTMYTQNAMRSPQTTIPPRILAVMFRISDCNPVPNTEIMADRMVRHNITLVLASSGKTLGVTVRRERRWTSAGATPALGTGALDRRSDCHRYACVCSCRRLTPQVATNADRFRLLSQCPFSGRSETGRAEVTWRVGRTPLRCQLGRSPLVI